MLTLIVGWVWIGGTVAAYDVERRAGRSVIVSIIEAVMWPYALAQTLAARYYTPEEY